jgi:hypothetical protein
MRGSGGVKVDDELLEHAKALVALGSELRRGRAGRTAGRVETPAGTERMMSQTAPPRRAEDVQIALVPR